MQMLKMAAVERKNKKKEEYVGANDDVVPAASCSSTAVPSSKQCRQTEDYADRDRSRLERAKKTSVVSKSETPSTTSTMSGVQKLDFKK